MSERVMVELLPAEADALSNLYESLFADGKTDPLATGLARCHKAYRVEHPNLASGEHPAQAPPDAAAPPPLLPGVAAPAVECCGCGHVNEAWARESSWCEGCGGWYGGPSGEAA